MIIQRIFQRHTLCIVRKMPKVSVDHFQNVLKHEILKNKFEIVFQENAKMLCLSLF